MSTKLNHRDVSNSKIANELEPVLNQVLQSQSWFEKRKNTLFAVANGIIQIANLLAFATFAVPWQVTVAIGVLVFLAEAVLHGRTRGPVTPSGARAVIEEAVKGERQVATVPVYHRPEDVA